MRYLSAIGVGVVTLGLVVLAGPSAHAQMRGMGRLNGVVVSDSGEPIDGVTVKAPTSGGDALEGKSGDAGKWAIGGIGKGEWQVEFQKAGFETKRLKVIVQKESLNPEVIKVVLKKAS